MRIAASAERHEECDADDDAGPSHGPTHFALEILPGPVRHQSAQCERYAPADVDYEQHDEEPFRFRSQRVTNGWQRPRQADGSDEQAVFRDAHVFRQEVDSAGRELDQADRKEQPGAQFDASAPQAKFTSDHERHAHPAGADEHRQAADEQQRDGMERRNR